ncbi:ABC transporter permease [Cellulomonas palmilytica]|uniref:ABC transporter permease n=1 Tax=Cellulomonas palmilytica TaxID=2608402 RepID=UPI001F24DC4E|nr:ABC transporter permease [Cellulomonas palmilytica]UJP40347.1 hypothetical protein F1D97_02090 [Cellulomonas palmilytica]
MSTTSSGRDEWRRTIAVALGACVAVCVVVLAFLWPTVTSTVQDIPVVVAGPAAEQMIPAVEEAAQGRLDLSPVADRDAAVAQIQQREAYGALVLGPEPEVLVASAASPAVAQVLRAVAPQLGAQAGAAVVVTDVVPLAASDPNGTGLAAAGFPLMFGGLIGGIVISLAVRGTARRLVALGVYAVVGGLAVAAVLQPWLGVLQGDYLANAGAYALTFTSMAAAIVGAAALAGRAGIALGPVVFMLFANPIASAGAPTQYLPGAWGTVGQLFPPGASATLVRTLSYFPDAATARPLLVLTGWALAGVALLLAAAAARRSSSPAVPAHTGPDADPAGTPTEPHAAHA